MSDTKYPQGAKPKHGQTDISKMPRTLLVNIAPDCQPTALAPYLESIGDLAGDVALRILEEAIEREDATLVERASYYTSTRRGCINATTRLMGKGFPPADLGDLPLDVFDSMYAALIMELRKHLSYVQMGRDHYHATGRNVLNGEGKVCQPYTNQLGRTISGARKAIEQLARYRAWYDQERARRKQTFAGRVIADA